MQVLLGGEIGNHILAMTGRRHQDVAALDLRLAEVGDKSLVAEDDVLTVVRLLAGGDAAENQRFPPRIRSNSIASAPSAASHSVRHRPRLRQVDTTTREPPRL